MTNVTSIQQLVDLITRFGPVSRIQWPAPTSHFRVWFAFQGEDEPTRYTTRSDVSAALRTSFHGLGVLSEGETA